MMTENEARRILFNFFNKALKPEEAIWIGESIDPDERGYSFPAGIYQRAEGLPDSFPLWAVNAIDKSVCPHLA